MSEHPLGVSNGPGRMPRAKEVEIGGKAYVIVPKSDYERLCMNSGNSGADAAALAVASVGPDLRARRHRARMTLSQVAQRARIASETLSRIENGRTNPSVATVQSILRALECAS